MFIKRIVSSVMRMVREISSPLLVQLLLPHIPRYSKSSDTLLYCTQGGVDILDSQFIVINISVLHVNRQSLLRFQTSRECWKAMVYARASKSLRLRLLIRVLSGWAQSATLK